MSLIRMVGELALNATGWFTSLSRAEKASNAFAKNVSHHMRNEFGKIFTAHYLVHQAKEVMEYAAHIYDASKALQVSKKDLQEFDFAAQKNGATLETVAKAFRMLAKARTEALEGNGGKMKVFEALGISKESLRNSDLATTFRAIAEGFRTKDFGQNELGMAEQIFGSRETVEHLLTIFKSGLGEATSEAEHLGLVLEDKVINALKQMDDELIKLKFSLRGPFAESIVWVAKKAQDLVGWLKTAGTWWGGFSVDPKKGTAESYSGPIRGPLQSIGRRLENAERAVYEAEKENAAGDAAGAHARGQERAKAYFEFEDAKEKQKAVEEAKKVMRIREQIYDIQRKTQMRGLDDAQKEERILNEIFKKRLEIERMRREGKPLSEQLEKQKDVAQLQDELDRLREDRSKHDAEYGLFHPQDSLAKVGGFTQFADAYLPLKTPLERIATATEATAANTSGRFIDPAGLVGGS